jgi:hypothetical protein
MEQFIQPPQQSVVYGDMTEQQQKQRDFEKEVDQSRAELVKRVVGCIKEAKTHFKSQFDQMKKDAEFAAGNQWGKGGKDAYVANLTLRHINQRVASIYAKNPIAVAKRKKRLDFAIWDGDENKLMEAMAAVQIAMQNQQMPDENAIALLQDVENGKAKRAMLDKLGKTLEIVFKYSLDEPMPRFKSQAKQLVRRVLTTKVGFIKLGYQRAMQQSPDVQSQIQDHSAKIAHLQMLSEKVADGDVFEHSAEMEELKIGLQQLQQAPEIITREGLVFDFPRSHHIIVDPDCTQLKGFVGAKWVAQEYVMTPDKIKKIYGVDVGDKFTAYTKDGYSPKKNSKDKSSCLVWEYYDLEAQTVYTVCDGYHDFLRDGNPDVELEQFHPFFVITFNDIESDETIYPPSDVELMRPMQMEHNRSREGLREHRVSNTPAYIGAKGILQQEDKTKLASHEVNEFLELNIAQGTDIRTVLQPKPTNPIDPAVYDTSHLFEDIQRVQGSQEANFGGTSGATATESSISENSRLSSVQSNIDDLDDFLSDVARAAGQILLKEMSEETVKKIAGEGATWATYSATEIAEELYLEVKAGSSGRPNRTLKIANLERIAPFIIQTPDLNPKWFLKQLVMNVDDDIDLEDAILSGMPSIVSMNANAQMATGDPSTDPNMQGGKGGNNKPQADKTQGGAQAAMPAPN